MRKISAWSETIIAQWSDSEGEFGVKVGWGGVTGLPTDPGLDADRVCFPGFWLERHQPASGLHREQHEC